MYFRKLTVLFTFLAILMVSSFAAVQARPSAPVTLPIGETAYKLTLAADGLYEITAEQLLAAGMEIATVDPSTIEMMQHGETVSYQFIGDDDAIFESGERIRFYGWAFDGPKHEKRFIGDTNLFWVWANGTAATVSPVDNPTGYTQMTTAPAELVFEEDNYFDLPYIYEWEQYENEPDEWYWDRYPYHFNDVSVEYSGEEQWFPSKNYTITIPYPADTAEPAQFMAEFLTTHRGTYAITTTLAGESASETWHYWKKNDDAFPIDPFPELPQLRNNNIYGTVANNALNNGDNIFNISGEVKGLDGKQYSEINGGRVEFNRIVVNYTRKLIADGDQLIFNGSGEGSYEYLVSGFFPFGHNQSHVSSGFTQGVPIVWNLSDRHNPQIISVNPSDMIDPVDGSATDIGQTLRIAAAHGDSAQFIATSAENILTPNTIEAYTAPSIEPQEGAEWLAITYADFIPAINTLAEYRQQPTVLDSDGFITHVVDLEDIINQYGYGFLAPEGIKAYLHHALLDWTITPDYVVLGGDASWNPLNRECVSVDCPDWWDTTKSYQYLPVDIEFSNLEVGLFITDYTYSTLLGDDLTAEFAIGRFPAQTLEEMQIMVDKTILYDQRMLEGNNTNRFVLPSDNRDIAGDFCEGNNELVRLHIPDYYETIEICMDDTMADLGLGPNDAPNTESKDIWKNDVFAAIDAGVDLLNYRGHGGVDYWQAPKVLNTEHAPFINNVGKPAVFVSHDCLDGDFSRNGRTSLAEQFLKLENKGTAAHVGATSLGYNWQHMVVQRGFYSALFDEDVTQRQIRIGDAMLSGTDAYLAYETRAEFRPFVAEMVLLGDPALLLRPVEELSVNVSSQGSLHTSADRLLPTVLLTISTVAVTIRLIPVKRRP